MLRRAGLAVLIAIAVALVGWLALTRFRNGEVVQRRSGPLSLTVGATQLPGTQLEAGPLILALKAAAAPVAVDSRYLVWERGDPEGEGETDLLQRDLRTGWTVTLARNVRPIDGVASTPEWVVYGGVGGVNGKLVAIRHDGSERLILGNSPPTELAYRGQLVAWARERGPRQQIVVRDMRTGRLWVAADVPRCVRRRC